MTEGIGTRIVVTGMAGAGKSTFSHQLGTVTGLPVIHLDLHSWKPGWVPVSTPELVAKQRILMAANRWIVDSNDVDEELLLARAETLVVLATPWWLCALRAFRRGIRRPPETQLPDGCEESISQRIRDEWGIVWRNWRHRKAVSRQDRALAERCDGRLQVFVLGSKSEQGSWISQLALRTTSQE